MFCPNCGFEIHQEFNFCPACGNELTTIENTVDSFESIITNVVVCSVCGEDNDSTNSICSGCGAKLKGETIERTVKPQPVVAKKIEPPKPKQKKGQPGKSKPIIKKEKFEPEPVTEKTSNNNIFVIFGGLLVIGILILYAAGVFDIPTTENNPDTNQTAPGNSGIDLNALNHINELEDRVSKDPKNAELILELAHLRNDSGFPEKAIERYKQYLAINPGNPDVIIDMGVCYFNLKRFVEADSVIRIALKINPNHQIGNFNLGIIYLAQGNNEKANEWFQKTIDINPTSEMGQKAKQLIESHTK